MNAYERDRAEWDLRQREVAALERIAAALEAAQSTIVEYETKWVFSEDVNAAKQEGWEIAGVRTLEDAGPDAYLWYKMRRIEATDTPRQQPAPAQDAAGDGGPKAWPYTWSPRNFDDMLSRETELQREMRDLEDAMEDYGRVMDDMHGLEPDCLY